MLKHVVTMSFDGRAFWYMIVVYGGVIGHHAEPADLAAQFSPVMGLLGRQVSVFKVSENSGWVTEAQPFVYRIGDEEAPAVLQTCQLDLDARISATIILEWVGLGPLDC